MFIMKKTLKRTFGMMLAIVMTISSLCCVTAFANEEEIPEGLPAGAYKVAEGIYAVDSLIMPINDYEDVNIGSVPASGSIVQPGAMSRVIIDSGDKWLCVKSSEYIRINFVYKTTSIFGDNYLRWPSVGSNPNTTYFIDVDYYNFQTGVPYKMQCTSANGNSHSNVTMTLLTRKLQTQA